MTTIPLALVCPKISLIGGRKFWNEDQVEAIKLSTTFGAQNKTRKMSGQATTKKKKNTTGQEMENKTQKFQNPIEIDANNMAQYILYILIKQYKRKA